MFWLALATAISALVTTIIGLYEVVKKLHRVEKVATADLHNTIELKHEINSRLTELLEMAREASRLQGHKEGVEAEQARVIAAKEQGIQGPQGQQGQQGQQGEQGQQGQQGSQGQQGQQGEQGEQGVQGKQGKTRTQTGEEGHHLHDH